MDDAKKRFKAACVLVDGAKSICGEGKKDVKAILAAVMGVELEEGSAKRYSIGDRFRHETGTVYMLASAGNNNRIVLINTERGGSYYDDVRVSDAGNITPAELSEICANNQTFFVRIETK